MLEQPTSALPRVPDLSPVSRPGSDSSATVDLLDLARELDAAGERSAAQKLIDRAALAAEPRRVHVFSPGLVKSAAASGIVDQHGRRLPSAALQKAREAAKKEAQGANTPQKTQMRLSQALSSLGAYQGIVDPAMMTHATFAILKLAARLPLVQAIINTRVNQAMDAKWRVRLKNKRAPVTPGARKMIAQAEELLRYGGFPREPDRGKTKGAPRLNPRTGEPGVWDGNGYDCAMRWENFIAHIVRDRLSMGWGCYRIEAGSDEKKYPVAFFRPVASELIRKTLAPRPEWGFEGYVSTFDPPNENVSYMELNPFSLGQVSNGEALREYTWSQLGTVEGYPQAHAFGMSYPYCEVEACLELLASRADTQRFLSENYNNDHIPLGIVSVIGATLGEEGFYELQAALAKGGGMEAFYRLLYLHFLGDQPGAGVQFTPLKSQSGIEASLQWGLQYKTDLRDDILAVFQMNPDELGQRALDLSGPKLSGSGPDASLAHSKSKGFKPLMRSMSSSVTHHLVERIDPDFEHHFEQLDGVNEEEDARVATAWLAAGKTLNELADQKDEPRQFRPVETVLWEQLERDLKRELGEGWEERFGSEHELREVDALYEEECQKQGLPCIWSSAWSAPVGSAMGAFQIFQGEQGQNQQFRQQQQQAQMQQAEAQQQQPPQPGEDGTAHGPDEQGEAGAPDAPASGADGAMPGASEPSGDAGGQEGEALPEQEPSGESPGAPATVPAPLPEEGNEDDLSSIERQKALLQSSAPSPLFGFTR